MTPPLQGVPYWRMTRPGFLGLTLVAYALGVAIAWHAGARAPVGMLLAGLAIALLGHAAGNVLNDYEDARSGADAGNHDAIAPFTGGSGLIQHGAVGIEATRRYARLLLFACVLGGLLLVAWRRQPELLAIGGLGVALGWAYSSPPLALMARGLGEATVGIAWWLVVVGADALVRGHPSPAPVACGAGFALLVASVLLLNGFPDARADAAAGKRTLRVVLGARHAAWLFSALVFAAHAVAWWAAGFLPGGWAWAPLASLPPALYASLRLHRDLAHPARLRPAIIAMLAAVHLHALAWVVALATTAG